MHKTDNPDELARNLEERFKHQTCMVTLKHGNDHLGKARMQINAIYYDDDKNASNTQTLRVVGSQTGNTTDHAMFAIPWRRGEEGRTEIDKADNVAMIEAGGHMLEIIPMPMSESTGY